MLHWGYHRARAAEAQHEVLWGGEGLGVLPNFQLETPVHKQPPLGTSPRVLPDPRRQWKGPHSTSSFPEGTFPMRLCSIHLRGLDHFSEPPVPWGGCEWRA